MREFHIIIKFAVLIVLFQASCARSLEKSQDDNSVIPCPFDSCLQDGYYDCTMTQQSPRCICPCGIFKETPANIVLLGVTGILAFISAFIVIISYGCLKEGREAPGDIIAGLAVGDT